MLMPLAALVALAPLIAQTAEPIERTYDLRALDTFEEYDAQIADPRLPLHAAHLYAFEPEPDWLPWPSRGVTPGGDWAEIIENLLPKELPENTDLLDSTRELLVARTSPEGHRAIEALLADLESLVLRDCRIEVHLLDSSVFDSHRGGVLSSDATEALLASGALRGSQVMRSRLGRPASIEMISRQAFLVGLDTEVAQFSSASDPMVSVLVEGLLGGVQVDERVDGMLTLRMWARWGEAEQPMQTMLVGSRGEHMHMPVVDALLTVASADLRSGQSILIGGTDCPLGLLLRVRVDSPSVALTSGLQRLDLADALDRPYFREPYRFVTPSPSGGWNEIYSLPNLWGDLKAPVGPGKLELVLREWTEQPHAVFGKQLLARANGSDLERIRESLAEFLPPPASTYAIELRRGTVSVAQLLKLELADGGELIEDLPVTVQGVVRGADSFVLVGGTQRFYVRDYELQITTGAHIHQPIVSDLFDGVSVWARVLPGAEGTVEFQHEVRWSEVLDVGKPLIETKPDTEFPGLSFPRARARDSWSDRTIQLDRWIQLSTSSTGAGGVDVLYARIEEVAR